MNDQDHSVGSRACRPMPADDLARRVLPWLELFPRGDLRRDLRVHCGRIINHPPLHEHDGDREQQIRNTDCETNSKHPPTPPGFWVLIHTFRSTGPLVPVCPAALTLDWNGY